MTRTLILDDQLEALRARFAAIRHDRRRDRFRPAARRAGGRAGTGHHHRRRLPLLRDPRRAFIVADTPGHEQYTRNMVTGASDRRTGRAAGRCPQGPSAADRRHSFICSLLGIRHVVLAVNKIDLVDYDRAVFDRIAEAYAARRRIRLHVAADRSRSRRAAATTSTKPCASVLRMTAQPLARPSRTK